MACKTGNYRGIELTGNYIEAVQTLQRSREELSHDLVACLDQRFQSNSDKILQTVLKFDIKLWPESDDDLATYGNEEVPLLLEHFKEVLTANGCVTECVMPEWACLKKAIRRNYRSLKWGDL